MILYRFNDNNACNQNDRFDPYLAGEARSKNYYKQLHKDFIWCIVIFALVILVLGSFQYLSRWMHGYMVETMDAYLYVYGCVCVCKFVFSMSVPELVVGIN